MEGAVSVVARGDAGAVALLQRLRISRHECPRLGHHRRLRRLGGDWGGEREEGEKSGNQAHGGPPDKVSPRT